MRRTFEAAPSMRGVGVLGPDTPELPVPEADGHRAVPRLDRRELALLAAFAAVSVWVLALDLWQVFAHGQIWTGTDGVFITDQLQYLAWIQSASHSGLVANLFVLHGTPADYFQPAIVISGLLTAAGVAPTVALLVWKPVAVGAIFMAARTLAVRTLDDPARGARLAAVALALFYGCVSIVYGKIGVVGDLFPGFLSWGYPFALMGVAASTFAMVTYASARRARRVSLLPAALAALAGSLHPWQGEVLCLVLVGGELMERELLRDLRALGLRRTLATPRGRLAAVTLAGALLPLLYYLGLDRVDLSWALGEQSTSKQYPALAIGLTLAPLAAVALLGYRGRPNGFLGRAVRLWPIAAVLVYLGSKSGGGAPLHAFDGITLPLSVLAVNGVSRLGFQRLRRRRAIATAVVLLATVPATVYEMVVARHDVLPSTGNANFISASENKALNYLRTDSTPGGVLTRFYLGSAVPARTGRRTYVGDCMWSEPNCSGRQNDSRSLLDGLMPPIQARQFVENSHARFVLADCGANSPILGDELGPMLVSVHQFGCATVYEVS